MTEAHQQRRRSPNLTQAAVREILDIIDGWAGEPLTWAALTARIWQRLGATYTRQALHRHTRIAAAFSRRRLEAASETGTKQPRGSVEVQKARESIARLQAKIERLEDENRALTEQFLVWLYNANARGVSVEQLNRALPPNARR
jgi:hypothetical protein